MSESPLDELLPEYDVSDAVALVVSADLDSVWNALLAADLIELGRRRPIVGALGFIRVVPEIVMNLVRGKGLPAMPDRMTLFDTASAGDWTVLLDRPNEVLALGLVGKFWRPIIQYLDVTKEEFTRLDEPGYAKTIYALSLTPLGQGRTLLRGEMRTATTDEQSRRKFRRYWTFGVGSGAHILVHSLLESVRDIAETKENSG